MKIKIKLFDDFKFCKDLKAKIELIDFPGLHTKNNFCEEKIFNPLMKFCDGFIFLNKSDLIEDKSNVDALKEIMIRIESRKFSFNMNSCLFILNNFGNQNLNIQKAKLSLEELIFGKIREKGFWNNFSNIQKSNFNLNLVEFNDKLYQRSIDFYKRISDFKQFIKKCIQDNEKDVDEDFNEYEQSLDSYIKNNYINSFENVNLPNQMTQRNNELLGKLDEVIKLDKNEADSIIKYYIFMIDNKDKYKMYKKSNAEKFFKNIKNLIMTVRKNFDENCRNIFVNYINNLSYIFYIINLNLLGNSTCREENIEKCKEEIQSLYNEHKVTINNLFINLETNCFKKIDDNIANLTKDTSTKISEEILKKIEQTYTILEKLLENYRKEIEKIRKKAVENIKKNTFKKVSFDNSIYKNLISMDHFFTHGGLLLIELLCPISWFICLIPHALIGVGMFIYDTYKKLDTIKENMKKFKENLKIKFEGDKEKIIYDITEQKNNFEKEIELIVDSKNSDFKGIKENRVAFDELVNQFIEMNKIEE